MDFSGSDKFQLWTSGNMIMKLQVINNPMAETTTSDTLSRSECNIEKYITTYDREWIYLDQTSSNCGPLEI